jgi:hypothetical protein
MGQKNSVVYSGVMHTSYSQMYVLSENCPGPVMLDAAFEDHVNRLCGGAVLGGLYLYVGVHSGDVHITVEVHDAAPQVDASWEEIVEASCVLGGAPIRLQGWAGASHLELPLQAGSHRARFCATGYGKSDEVRVFGDPAVERYALLLWPAPPAPDVVLKATREGAV